MVRMSVLEFEVLKAQLPRDIDQKSIKILKRGFMDELLDEIGSSYPLRPKCKASLINYIGLDGKEKNGIYSIGY